MLKHLSVYDNELINQTPRVAFFSAGGSSPGDFHVAVFSCYRCTWGKYWPTLNRRLPRYYSTGFLQGCKECANGYSLSSGQLYEGKRALSRGRRRGVDGGSHQKNQHAHQRHGYVTITRRLRIPMHYFPATNYTILKKNTTRNQIILSLIKFI
jgi:hypothetical protein